jgi:hypothetical protein
MARIVYISHRILGNELQNAISVNAVCEMLASEDVIPFAPYLAFSGFLNRQVEQEALLERRYCRAFFQRRAFDEFWICSAQDNVMRLERKWAEEFNIPIVDVYNDSSQVSWMKDLTYNLNVEIRGWAKRGLEAQLKEAGIEARDKSGSMEKLQESLNAAVALIRTRVKSISDSVVSVTADDPTEEPGV